MLERIRKGKDEGFTLIELLIVIIILGILAAIVVFAVGSTRGDSVTATCKTDVKSIQLGAEAVKTKTGSYPTNNGSGTGGILVPASGAVMKAWPGGTTASTTTSDDLAFSYSGTSSTYTLTVFGKNLTANGTALDQTATDAQVATACAD